MKYLVFGGFGQLGMALQRVCPDDVELYPVSSQIDITSHSAVEGMIDLVKPDVVVNAAAYTNVVGAEDNYDKAFNVNALGPAIIGAVCNRRGIRFIHISSDYVFDGLKGTPYNSWDETKPLNAYGRSKEIGEIFVNGPQWYSSIVIRTSWVFSEFNSNFAKTILTRAKEGQTEFSVVCDQIGTPTYAVDLAKAIFEYGHGGLGYEIGIAHYAGDIHLSWWDFTILLTEGIDSVIVTASKTTDQKVVRPKNSALYSSFGIKSDTLKAIDRVKSIIL